MAYTPGLKRKELTIVRKVRRLPIVGTVTVQEGDTINVDTVVARTTMPGNPVLLNVAEIFGMEAGVDYISDLIKKKEGDQIKKDEPLAISGGFFGFFKNVIASPVDGQIENISDATGIVIIREAPEPLEVRAYIPGKVIKIFPNTGCEIECPAALIQGIFGIGGEKQGDIKTISEDSHILTENDIDKDDNGKILVLKYSVDSTFLKKASEVGVKGIIMGGIDEQQISEYMGYELGVAITGEEEGVTLIITEGFGTSMKMSDKTFDILKKLEGSKASINGATQIRAGVLRPEIIIPRKASDLIDKEYTIDDTKAISSELTQGTIIRIIQPPHFGEIGVVVKLIPELQTVNSGSLVRVLEAELTDGQRVIIPRANVEIITE